MPGRCDVTGPRPEHLQPRTRRISEEGPLPAALRMNVPPGWRVRSCRRKARRRHNGKPYLAGKGCAGKHGRNGAAQALRERRLRLILRLPRTWGAA